ncbi:cytosine permease [soil metagenome]
MATHESTSSADRVGKIEQAGIEYIAEADRDSRPLNLFYVYVGSNFTWSIVIFGWLPVALGLDFWGALTSTVFGLALGCVLMMPVAIIGPRTGTNMTVASGAFFGIRGRLIGSVLALVLAIVYGAMAIWTSGDAVVAAAHRLTGMPDNDLVKAAAYAVISVGVVVLALYGHATIVAVQKIVIPIIGVLLLAGFFVFAPQFDTTTRIDDYVLDGYWPTWVLSAVLGFASAPSYVTSVGDYTRRISQHKFSDLHVAGALAAGLFVGNLLPMVFGMYSAVVLVDPTDSYVADLVAVSPAWYVIAIVVIALMGGLGQGVLNLYSSGLDLEGLLPRFSRVQTTIVTAVVAVILLYAGVFLVDAVAALTAVVLVLNAVTVPWAAVMVIGALRHRRVGFDPGAIQAFADGRQGGKYWFTGGWNGPTVAAWAAGSLFGVLAVDSELYSGPLSMLAGGIDLSCVGSALVTGVTCLALGGARPVTAEH